MDCKSTDVRKRHSFYLNQLPKTTRSRELCKSDMNVVSSLNENQHLNVYKDIKVGYECSTYTSYGHEIPVRDNSSFNDHSFSEERDSGRGDNRDSISNSDLDEMEMKTLKKMSQELQADDCSVGSLDSNIKLFKTTVDQILDKFYTSMRDFEIYKKKFHEILEKNRGDSVAEMEDFIKDMVQYIGSSDSSGSRDNTFREVKAFDISNPDNQDNCRTVVEFDKEKPSNSLNSTIETFKNENYLTDSTFEQKSSKSNTGERNDESLNIFLLSGTRCVEIKMNDRNLFSEINIRDQRFDGIKEPLASAENIKKLEAKKLEVENYSKQKERRVKDRDIPVKSSVARNNIHMEDDLLGHDKDECQKFFIFRICNYICRKIRKNTL